MRSKFERQSQETDKISKYFFYSSNSKSFHLNYCLVQDITIALITWNQKKLPIVYKEYTQVRIWVIEG